MPVNTPRKEYDNKLAQWQRCRDCFDGSDAIKARGILYLPMLGGHTKDTGKYEAYKTRALYYNAFGRTVIGLTGAVFQKDPTLTLAERLKKHAEDITLNGTPLSSFAFDLFEEVMKLGRAGVLIDMKPKTVDGEQRPYWVRYNAENILSWRTETRNGDEVLTRVILHECVEAPNEKDPFVVDEIEQCRVLELIDNRATVTLWRKVDGDSDKWAPVAADGAVHGAADNATTITLERRGIPLSFLPFVFCGPGGLAARPEKPPLLDLADVNLSHYRTSADHEHGRHFTSLPQPWVSGLASEGPLSMGSGVAWSLSENGDAGMLEYTGQGLKELSDADKQKREMMATLGGRLLEAQQSQGNDTATAVQLRHSGEHASLRSITSAVEMSLTAGLRMHGWWAGMERDPRDVKALVELNKDFFSMQASADEVRSWLLALQGGGMAFETFYFNIQRGGLTRPGVTAEIEKQSIDSELEEAAARAAEFMGDDDPNADPDADPDDQGPKGKGDTKPPKKKKAEDE